MTRTGTWGVAVAAALLLGSCASVQTKEAERGRQVRRAMAAQLAQRGDWNGAFEVADGVVKEDPEDTVALLLRAKALRQKEMPQEAEADLVQVIRLDPRQPEAHAELGVLCERALRSREALTHHQEARKLAPGDPRYLNNLAFAMLIRGKPREALPLLEEALRVEPGNPRLRNNMGFALAAVGDFGRAAEQFRLAGTPQDAKNNLGMAYERSGNLTQAYETYLQAWRLDPGDARTRANLEHVARKTGREMPPDRTATVSGTGEKGGG